MDIPPSLPPNPLLSTLPAASTTASTSRDVDEENGSTGRFNEGKDARQGQSSRSRRRQSSSASSVQSNKEHLGAGGEASLASSVSMMQPGATGSLASGSVTPDGVSGLDRKYDGNEEEDDDDLVAIPGEDTFLRGDGEGRGGSGYRRIDGPGRVDRAVIVRKILINLALIASWFFFSTMMNLYNSWLFSEKRHNFSYPLFVTSVHMLIQFFLSSILMTVCHQNRRIVPRRANGKRARPEARDWASKVVPCALATALDIGLSNLSLKTITLTFYTMCKSSNLAFVLFFAFLFKLEKLRLSLIGIIALITIGVIMMVAAETQFVLEGAIEVLTASAMGGLRWALTQMLLHKNQMGMDNPIATIFWLSPLMSIFMVISSMLIEDWRGMFASDFFLDFTTTMKTIALMVAPGFIAFMMNLSEFALIQRTSVMTLSVAGIFKEIATILLSSTVFGDELTPINVTGLCVALSGIGLYNYLKYRLLMRNSFNEGSHRLREDDGSSCTEMGGTRLPTSGGGGGADGSGSYTQLSRGASSQVKLNGAGASLSEEEQIERQRLREEEADMTGWNNSGTTRTGDGYHDGMSSTGSDRTT